jgi:hypothetical protein
VTLRRTAPTYVDRAAKERALLQSLLDDLEQVGRRLLQLIPLSNASGEVLEALGGGTPRERFIASIDPTRGECMLPLSLTQWVLSSLKVPPCPTPVPLPGWSSWDPPLSFFLGYPGRQSLSPQSPFPWHFGKYPHNLRVDRT